MFHFYFEPALIDLFARLFVNVCCGLPWLQQTTSICYVLSSLSKHTSTLFSNTFLRSQGEIEKLLMIQQGWDLEHHLICWRFYPQ